MSRYELYSRRYPLLALKNVVIFPRNVVTLSVGRSRSISAVEEAWAHGRRIVFTAPRNPDIEDPQFEDLYPIGTLCEVSQAERQPGGSIQVVLEGLARVRLNTVELGRPFLAVQIEEVQEVRQSSQDGLVLVAYVKKLVEQHGEQKGKLTSEVLEIIRTTEDASQLADLLATQLITGIPERQAMLEESDPAVRLERLAVGLTGDLDVLALEQRIKERVREQIDKNQREYYLREQLKAIHDELGGEGGNEIELLREKVKSKELGAELEDRLLKEVTRLERMPAISAEATVVRNYLDWALSLPWQEQSEDTLDLDVAEQVLEEDHFGLEQVKERIIEFLAVRKLKSDRVGGAAEANATILCLHGPPGVGKTSLGRSIAESMGRKFVRVSLGGVRDEAEIRGHRRTYIGAFPGRLIQALKTAGTKNPVVLLDEIDKLSSDQRGDPSSALLEVLDPEQNRNFVDHYLDLPFDLSGVLFICTANSLGPIPRPLRDRMEIVDIGGYTEDEKVEIARRYLLPKQLEAHGLERDQVEFSEKLIVQALRNYTSEAGVRGLERQIGKVCRKVAREVVKGKAGRIRITASKLEEFLGPPRYGFEQGLGGTQIGVAIGLGATEIGGVMIPVEVATMPGRGTLTITGQAGEVMQESARAALSYARSRAEMLKIDPDFQQKLDLHIHLPEGAQPKDGPSAGITMATALISALTGRSVRHDVAMTGEITLRGRVLPIGGLKEKTLAAHRNGIRRLVAPAENKRDLILIPKNVAKEMEFFWVENMDDVIAQVLLQEGEVEGVTMDIVVPPDALTIPEAAAQDSAF
ncbi:MAG TPA: endopeptidase La [Thermomicrobiales bacterium]|jgi:ATP-dependent Lon protease